jgi:hypothetical protein
MKLTYFLPHGEARKNCELKLFKSLLISVHKDVAPCSRVEAGRRFRGANASIIAQMVEAVGTSETTLQSAVFQQTAKRKISGVLHVLV